MYENNDCTGCFISALISIFLHSFDWTFVALTLHNLKKIFTNPIEGILKPDKRLKIYLIITFATAGITTLLSFMASVHGRSVIINNNILAYVDMFY